MFRLFTFAASIVGFAAVVWFGVTVELGQRTLFGHLRAIGASAEAKELWDGTKDKVTDFVGIEAARRAEAAKAAFKNPELVPAKEAPAPEAGPAVEREPATKPAAAPPPKASAPKPVLTKPAPRPVVVKAAASGKPAPAKHAAAKPQGKPAPAKPTKAAPAVPAKAAPAAH